MKKSIIALVICIIMLLCAACQVTINLPPQPTVAPALESTPAPQPTENIVPQASAAPAEPSAEPVQAAPAVVDENTYRALESQITAVISADCYYKYSYLSRLMDDMRNNEFANTITPEYAETFLYLLANYSYEKSAQPNPSLALSGNVFGDFVAFKFEDLKKIFDFVFHGRFTVENLQEANYEYSVIEIKDNTVYVGMGDPEGEFEVEYLRVNDDGTVSYKYEYDLDEIDTEGVVSVKLVEASDTDWGVYIESYTIDSAATEMPVSEFVYFMRDTLDRLDIEYEVLGPHADAYNPSIGNPIIANADYFWLEATTELHDDDGDGDVLYMTLKFNNGIDEKGKEILLTAIRSLSYFASMDELNEALKEIDKSGQAFVGSTIVEFSNNEYRINLPDKEWVD